MNRVFPAVCLSVLLPFSAFSKGSLEDLATDPVWPAAVSGLVKSLKDDGVKKKHHLLLEDGAVPFISKAVTYKMLSKVKPPPDTSLYSNEDSVRRGRDFMTEHFWELLDVWQNHGPPPSVVTAIMRVENDFGNTRGAYPVLFTLASLASLRNEKIREKVLPEIKKLAAQYDPLTGVTWEERAEAIGNQFYDELKAFFALAQRLKWDEEALKNLKGSIVGAIGYSQGMPTSVLKWSKERKIDLWNWSDAIHSTAAHLNDAGWRKNPEEAMLGYNRVKWYRAAVFSLANELKSRERELYPEAAATCLIYSTNPLFNDCR